MNLESLLTELELNSLPFPVECDRFCSDLIRAVKNADGGAVYVGGKDDFFSEPYSFTSSEFEDYIDFLHSESIDPPSRAEFSALVYGAAIEVDSSIVKKILSASASEAIAA